MPLISNNSFIAFPIAIYRYEMSNCLYEATLQKISKECGCNPIKFFKVDESFTACEGAQRHCMQRHLEDMGVERTIEDGGVQKECWAACVDQTYRDEAGRRHNHNPNV